MTLNPYFLQGSTGEQSLVQDLINEQLKMYGVEIYYIPRRYMTTNTIIREVVESEFTNSYPIEAYIENFEGYGDNPVFLSKFGVQATNELTVTLSRERFENYISPLMKNVPNVELSTRPKEGDLVYFPLGDRLFEIKFVEHEKPFYQLKKNYVYTLRCELFRPEDEVIDTGIEAIDDTTEVDFNLMTLTVVTAGTQASAYTEIVDGAIGIVTITSRGEGYVNGPTVAISSAPSSGITAVGIATLLGGLVDCDGLAIGEKVQGVELVNPGAGYTVAPGIVFIDPAEKGVGAAATTLLADGAVGVVTISDGGTGYTTAPAVTFTGAPGIGTTAVGKAYLNSIGVVTSITLTNAGAGYTVVPTITIEAPYGGGSGNFIVNEYLTGSIGLTSARVMSWDYTTGEINIANWSGAFTVGELLTGAESGAVYQLKAIQTDNTVSAYPDNDEIELEGDNILDFSESNPFGNP